MTGPARRCRPPPHSEGLDPLGPGAPAKLQSPHCLPTPDTGGQPPDCGWSAGCLTLLSRLGCAGPRRLTAVRRGHAALARRTRVSSATCHCRRRRRRRLCGLRSLHVERHSLPLTSCRHGEARGRHRHRRAHTGGSGAATLKKHRIVCQMPLSSLDTESDAESGDAHAEQGEESDGDTDGGSCESEPTGGSTRSRRRDQKPVARIYVIKAAYV